MAGDSVVLSSAGSLLTIRENFRGMRFDLGELSGSLGDLGTFIPLVVAISITNGMNIGIILVFAGLFNITTGLIFGLPIPVQPMKAIAAVIIAEGLSPASTAAAGLIAGLVMLILGLSKTTEKLESIIPRAVVRGIQLGIGAHLFIKGLSYITETNIWGPDSMIVAAVLVLLVLIGTKWKRLPSALVLFAVGIAITALIHPQLWSNLHLNVAKFPLIIPGKSEWLDGLLRGTIPQIPLTLLNSVIAVCLLSGDLFPGRSVPTSRMAASVGVMNLIGCWFGAMPMCHGSGGLAGQYRFGARTGGSVVMLGFGKLLLGLFLGGAAMQLLHAYPSSVLGVMLLFAGYELAKQARQDSSGWNTLTILITGTTIVVYGTAIGFAVGIVIHILVGTVRSLKR